MLHIVSRTTTVAKVITYLSTAEVIICDKDKNYIIYIIVLKLATKTLTYNMRGNVNHRIFLCTAIVLPIIIWIKIFRIKKKDRGYRIQYYYRIDESNHRASSQISTKIKSWLVNFTYILYLFVMPSLPNYLPSMALN